MPVVTNKKYRAISVQLQIFFADGENYSLLLVVHLRCSEKYLLLCEQWALLREKC